MSKDLKKVRKLDKSYLRGKSAQAEGTVKYITIVMG